MIAFPSPADEEDERDEQATRITSATLAAMLIAAEDAGWHIPELLVAMLSTLVDAMVDGAGVPATRETLKALVIILAERADR